MFEGSSDNLINTVVTRIKDVNTELGIYNIMFKQKYCNTSVTEKLESKINYTGLNGIQK